jgi:ABC-type siderophore export system fused ATPase/permease subunit
MSMFLVIVTEQYVAEKRFVKETETIRLQEYYMLCSVKKAESLMKEEEMPTEGVMNYRNGSVSYERRALSANMEQVTFNLKLKSGEISFGIGQYDKGKMEMVKWIEKN